MRRLYGITGLPKIRSLGDLSAHTRISTLRLWRLIYKNEEAYSTFYLPKKSGGQRRISHPNSFLKRVQRWILRNILERLHPAQSCYGFLPDSKLRTHAQQHVNSTAVLILDIENFFPSISIARIVRVYKEAGYSATGAWILARLCTSNGTLPQGAPTSPQLANLACHRLDRRLEEFAERRRLVYTRYADDLTFSGLSMSGLAKACSFITHMVKDSGFRLNNKKTRLVGPSGAKVVTGLVLAPGQVGVGRRRLRDLRARIHRAHLRSDEQAISSLQGWLDYVSDVDPDRYRTLVAYVKRLSVRLAIPHKNTVLSRLRVRDVA